MKFMMVKFPIRRGTEVRRVTSLKRHRSNAMDRLAAASLLILVRPVLSQTSLVVCCVGDSLIRPIPAHFRTLALETDLSLDVREWAQGGLSSDTYLSFFRRSRPKWEGTQCDAILIQLGTNDVVPLLEEKSRPEDFQAKITAILAELKRFPGRSRPRPVLFLATVPLFCDRPESVDKNRIVETVINPVLREIAVREGAVIVDNYAVLKNRPELYDPDCAHPNSNGEKALTRNWLQALRGAFPGVQPTSSQRNRKDNSLSLRRGEHQREEIRN